MLVNFDLLSWVWSLHQEYPSEEGTAIHYIILACRIPCTEEPGRLQSLISKSWTPLKQFSMCMCKATPHIVVEYSLSLSAAILQYKILRVIMNIDLLQDDLGFRLIFKSLLRLGELKGKFWQMHLWTLNVGFCYWILYITKGTRKFMLSILSPGTLIQPVSLWVLQLLAK